MGLLSDGRVGPDPFDRDNSSGSWADLNHAFLIDAGRCHRQGLAPALYSRDGTLAVLHCRTRVFGPDLHLPWAGEIKRYLEFPGGVCGAIPSMRPTLTIARIIEGDKPMHHLVSHPMALIVILVGKNVN